MPATLSLFEAHFLENADNMLAEDISLIIRVFATSRQSSYTFFLEFERAVIKSLASVSNTVLIEILTSLTLAREYMSQSVFNSIAVSADSRLSSFTPGQLIEIVRLLEYNQVEAFDCRKSFFNLTRSHQQMSNLSLEHSILALETLNFMGLPSNLTISTIESLVQSGKGQTEISIWSCSSSMTVLSILSDSITLNQLKESTVIAILKEISAEIPKFNSNQVPNMLQALVRLDEEWDKGSLSTQQLLTLFKHPIDAISKHIEAAGSSLRQEERLFAANFLAKLCQPAWQSVSLGLSTSAVSQPTAN